MRTSMIAIFAWIVVTQAWLPADRDLFKGKETTVSAGKGRTVKKWLPASGKIRGVNLGSYFIMERWMAATEWSDMGCGGYDDEFDCVLNIGQAAANTTFANHWATWITEDDIATMSSYGLNTIRVPVGYWMDESIVYTDSEYFPQGGLPYLEQVCGWASNYGFYIIIDLHGAPGAQVADQAFTGQDAPTAGFYQTYQYERAYSFLEFMTNLIHTNDNFRNVGMLEVVNEPIAGESTLISEYYPNAYNAIRNEEISLGITENNYLHVQFMDDKWGAGDPNADLPNGYVFTAYDNHRYLKYDPSVTVSQSGYLSTSCSDEVASDGDIPLIVGEWCISPADAEQNDSDFEISDGTNSQFYTDWYSAQVQAYEKQEGWIFWAWKAQLGDYRWSYQEAVEAGIIPTDPEDAYNYTCS